jgi:nitronate monooxygenase
MTLAEDLNIEHSIIGGPMYPCSNPELVAAVSEAGGIGVVQPITLTYVCGYDFREGLRYIKSLTSKPIGFNALIEKSSEKYEQKMRDWIDVALDEGVRFFITSLGNPDWVVEKVHAYGGKVYHDVTERKWADIAMRAGVDGFVAVNNRAGGHAGTKSKEELVELLLSYNLPVVCAGGIASSKKYKECMSSGYAGVQMGTRFIASTECDVSAKYKESIIKATEHDIVLTKKLTGIDVSVINTQGKNMDNGLLITWMLHHSWSKKFARIFLALKSLWTLKKSKVSSDSQSLWQAGKSVEDIHTVKSVSEIIKELVK